MRETRKAPLSLYKKILMPRSQILLLSFLGQLAVIVGVILRFDEYFAFFYGASLLLSLVAFLWVMNSRINPAYKIAWIIPIMLFPVFGGLFYLFLGRSKVTGKSARKMKRYENKINHAIAKERQSSREECLPALEKTNGEAAIQAKYIADFAGYPLYPDEFSEYLPIGEQKFERLQSELKKAEHFIFMEYFIIEEGVMWNRILQILIDKVAQGVDVRLIYDDAGCLFTLPQGYHRTLEAMGIKCCVFNPLTPIFSLRQNNRDHRKITVIDGYIGFTGGINLADEYINEIVKFGHWKDAAIILKGAAVWNLTAMFLSVWGYLRDVEEDFQHFRPAKKIIGRASQIQGARWSENEMVYGPSVTTGFVQPFADSPLDNEPVSETVYLNMIYKAKKSVYITTPYLIIANEMVTALCAAAKGGVDVRIITPHKWDKRIVHAVTRTYYKILVESGVKIYEYTPGFMHAKSFVVDDLFGVVGTINMDYRSLYLNFECGVWMFYTPSVLEVKQDFIDTLEVCQQITEEDFKGIRWYNALISSILRIFAPIL